VTTANEATSPTETPTAPTSTEAAATNQTVNTNIYTDCLHAYQSLNTVDGVYTIQPSGGQLTTAWCDMTNGGWTVIQRRKDGTENFERPWSNYSAGFGNRTGEYWLGLNNIHYLTVAESSLVIELEAFPGTTPLMSAETYSRFHVRDSASNYRIDIQNYVPGSQCSQFLISGEFEIRYDGLDFSTEDRETFFVGGNGCSWLTRSGWWHDNVCSPFSLNGLYHHVGYTPARGHGFEGITWNTCWAQTVPLMKSTMRVRRNV